MDLGWEILLNSGGMVKIAGPIDGGLKTAATKGNAAITRESKRDPSSRKALFRMTAEGGLALRVNLVVVLGESAQSPKQQQEQDNGEAGVRELRTGNANAEWKPNRGNVQHR
jgi:hypothetical protein